MKKISRRKTRQTWEPTVSDQLSVSADTTRRIHRIVGRAWVSAMEYLHVHDTNRNMTTSLRHVHQKYTCANMRAAQIMVHDTTHS